MAKETTLSIIKPDAVTKSVIGQIYTRFENAGLKIVAAKMMQLSREQAENFYDIHRARPFFKDLVDFMISGPVMVQALQGDNAVSKIEKLWVQQTLKKLPLGQYAQILPTALMPMQSMVQIVLRMQLVRSLFSLNHTRFVKDKIFYGI